MTREEYVAAWAKLAAEDGQEFRVSFRYLDGPEWNQRVEIRLYDLARGKVSGYEEAVCNIDMLSFVDVHRLYFEAREALAGA